MHLTLLTLKKLNAMDFSKIFKCHCKVHLTRMETIEVSVEENRCCQTNLMKQKLNYGECKVMVRRIEIKTVKVNSEKKNISSTGCPITEKLSLECCACQQTSLEREKVRAWFLNWSKEVPPDIKAMMAINEGKIPESETAFQNVEVSEPEGSEKDVAFRCEICNKILISNSGIENHLKIHSPCLFCNREFPSLNDYNLHLRTHTHELPFKCDICLLQFPSEDQLQAHDLSHSCSTTSSESSA